MSSIALLLGLATGAALAPPPEQVYADKTRVLVRCIRPQDNREIVVCGRRAADRWRAPLVQATPGDPRAESVSGERNRLASAPRPSCGTSAFFYACGFVGISVGIGSDGQPLRLRTPAD